MLRNLVVGYASFPEDEARDKRSPTDFVNCPESLG